MTSETIGNYRVLGLLGRGGMGEVYLGEHLETKTQVAIKILLPNALEDDPLALERAQREAEALRRLNHPNIVTILEVMQQGDQFILVMEYVGGGSLQQLIYLPNPLPLGYILRIALELADALARAHHLKIIHRDLKPVNILLAEDGTTRLTDFGVAYVESEENITQTGAIVGSPSYLAPEMVVGDPFDHRADIWAFGVILFELLKGGRLFEGKNPAESMYKVLSAPLPDINEFRADVPPELQDLLTQMLDRKPATRIDSMRKVGAQLENILRHLAVQTDVPEFVRQAVQTPKRPHIISRDIPLETQKTEIISTATRTQAVLETPAKGVKLNWRWAMVVLLAVLVLVFFPRQKQAGFEVITLEPVAEGRVMVLVGELEPLNNTERSRVTEFIVADLQDRLEQSAPLAQTEIRAYPHLIRSEAEAAQAAAANNALVVVWGNYNDTSIDLNIQLEAAGNETLMPLQALQDMAGVRVRMKDEREESVAGHVAGAIFLFQTASNDTFRGASLFTVLNEMDIQRPETLGVSVGAQVHRYLETIFTEPNLAQEALNAALQVDADNYMLYHLQATLLQRVDRIEEAQESAHAALRVGDAGWQTPHIVLGNIALQQNDFATSTAEFSEFLKYYPDDWFVLAVRGANYYMQGAYDLARADYERALALQPQASLPYTFASILAIREGRVADSQALLNTVLQDFTDPTIGERLVVAFTGGRVGGNGFYADLLSAFANLSLGQYQATLVDIESALAERDDLAELYLMQGLTYCLMGDNEAAEGAYSTGLELDSDFTVLYLLRADVRSRQNKLGESLLDFGAAQATTQWEEFEPFINETLASGSNALGCEAFFGN